jgi:hypothetical protein
MELKPPILEFLTEELVVEEMPMPKPLEAEPETLAEMVQPEAVPESQEREVC